MCKVAIVHFLSIRLHFQCPLWQKLPPRHLYNLGWPSIASKIKRHISACSVLWQLTCKVVLACLSLCSMCKYPTDFHTLYNTYKKGDPLKTSLNSSIFVGSFGKWLLTIVLTSGQKPLLWSIPRIFANEIGQIGHIVDNWPCSLKTQSNLCFDDFGLCEVTGKIPISMYGVHCHSLLHGHCNCLLD